MTNRLTVNNSELVTMFREMFKQQGMNLDENSNITISAVVGKSKTDKPITSLVINLDVVKP